MFSNIKLFFIGFSTIVVTIFTFLFNRRGKIIDEQEKVINAKEQEIKVSNEVHKSEISKEKLATDIKKEEMIIDKKDTKVKSDNLDKIYNTPDNIEYEVKL